ncbi:MAG: alpha/beta hydrolase [Armatimonas sp.]
MPTNTTYRAERDVPYCQIDGKTLILNAWLPEGTKAPTAAVVDIHGGWFIGGGPAGGVPDYIARRQSPNGDGVAFFSIQYRLGGNGGGFPECIRDCRNAIRFLRKNAARFHIDPKRIGVQGESAGGHLSLMVAMVPENFPDGGPIPELKGVSAKVSGSFSWIPPSDFPRFWDQGPDDVIRQGDGSITYRPWDDQKYPNDARPHLRALFHGVGAETPKQRELYRLMSPIGHVRRDVPPVLICDGAHDPIVPGCMGKDLYLALQRAGSKPAYWVSDGGHSFPGGPGFGKVLDDFWTRCLTLKMLP